MTAIIIYVLISVLIGGVSCFYGKKIYLPLLMLAIFSAVLTSAFSMFDLSLRGGIIAGIIGLAAASLAGIFYRVCAFLSGGMLGAALGIFAILFLPPAMAEYGWIVMIVLALIAGICAVVWRDFFMILFTSFNGAFAMVVPICFLVLKCASLQDFVYADGMAATMTNLNQYLNTQFLSEYGILIFILTAAAAFGGFLFQMRSERN